MPHIAKERIYVDKDGKVVPHDHPSVAMLAVGEGQEVDDETAKKYGIKEPKESKAESAPPENKAEVMPAKVSGLTINRAEKK